MPNKDDESKTRGFEPQRAEIAANEPIGWNTLEELRVYATTKGCTPAQFDQTVEAVGSDPYRVANYLQRHFLLLSRAVPE